MRTCCCSDDHKPHEKDCYKNNDAIVDHCLFYCGKCDEEYTLPEGSEECLICGSKDPYFRELPF